MSDILIDYIRISGLRGFKKFKMPLKQTTVLTGVNNVGKTTILKALQISLGSRAFLESDDFHIALDGQVDKIIVDIRIIPINEEGINDFSEDWESVFGVSLIKIDNGQPYVPLRTMVSYDPIGSVFKTEQSVLNYWEPANSEEWLDIKGNKQTVFIKEIPFFYEEAQRDIVNDLKIKTSFIGKMLSDVAKSYDQSDVEALENVIKGLNQKAIENSNILTTIQKSLSGVASTMDTSESVDISPFAKKIRDLNKSLSIQYGKNEHSFAMEYHGMGTRSWSSLLTLKAFIAHNQSLSAADGKLFFPIIAIEEPEAHLHPNAQKKLYKQISEIPGQKIISTHSQFIAASASIDEVIGLYKQDDVIKWGNICSSDLEKEDLRKLRQKVINTRGEVFFSKALVLFEGETEEQALPIIAKKYFNCDPFELGINMFGVGGAGSYLPFIRFAEKFNIPWYIFSDGENDPVQKMTTAVKTIRSNCFTTIEDELNVFIIDNGDDFEKYICQTHFEDILSFYKTQELNKCCNEQHKQAKEQELNKLTSANILELAKSDKTKWALIFADSIRESNKPLPQLVVDLCNKIKMDLGL
ncbi:MAG: AAA family ATPase [Akkermansia sp.]